MTLQALPPNYRGLKRSEYEQLAARGAFDGERVELLQGMIIRMSPIGDRHGAVYSTLLRLFFRLIAERVEIRAQLPFAVGDDSAPEPDLALVPWDDRAYRDGKPTSAYLLIEVSDTSLATDRGVKRELYAMAGVPEYWIVNLQDDCVEVHRAPVAGEYSERFAVGVDGEITLAELPDVTLAVGDFLP